MKSAMVSGSLLSGGENRAGPSSPTGSKEKTPNFSAADHHYF